MKLQRKSFIYLLVSACLVAVLWSCIQEPISPVRVGSNIWPGYESLYLARDLGYYKDYPIQLVDYPSATEVSRAFRNGNIELASLTLDETLLLAETNPEVRVILVMDISHGADVILAKPEIENLPSLKGKRVGVESTALGAYLITRALDKVGMSIKDIKVVPLSVSEHEQAFKQGNLDAVVTFEPVRSNLLAMGAKVIFDSRQIPGEIVDVLVVRADLLKTRKQTLQAIISGWFGALDYLQKNSQAAIGRMAVREGITSEQFRASLKLLHIPNLEENQKLLGKTDASLLAGAKRLSKIMLENKLLMRSPEINSLLDDRLVNGF